MPKRSRSHQLETESIRRFEQSLPSRWVCRRKNEDYGVDLEVEVFDERDEATGLIFLVQLKATDDLEEALAVTMKMDRLLYLGKLDCPSMLVRYCSINDSFHWKWLSNVFAEIGKPKTKTVTVSFTEADIWSNSHVETIVNTLQVYRTIRLASRQLPLGLAVDEEGCSDRHSFELNCAVAEIAASCRIVSTSLQFGKCLPVLVSIDDECLRARIDVITSISVKLQNFDRYEIAAQLSYVLVHFSCSYEFIAQVRELASFIQQRQYRCQSRNVASYLAAHLTDYPTLAGDIAALNGIHECQDEAYLMYVHSLLSSGIPFEERLATVSRFYSDALAFHERETPDRRAAIHYSFGNALRVSGAMRKAVRQYNLARRQYPDYLRRGYFLSEFAAALFFRRRYKMSAYLYQRAYEFEATPKVAICAGDANLFCGRFVDARRWYTVASGSDDVFESAEAALKDWMTAWVEQFSCQNELASGWALPENWMAVLERSVEEGLRDHAIGACLMLCYLTDENLAFWAQAISLTIGSEDPELVFAVIAAAISAQGHAAYALFRDLFVEREGLSDVLQNLDKVVSDLIAQRAKSNRHGVVTRLFREYHYDSVVDMPPGH